MKRCAIWMRELKETAPEDLKLYWRSPSLYNHAAACIDIIEEHTRRPCRAGWTWEGDWVSECDDTATCPRHDRSLRLAERLVRMRERRRRNA